MKRFSWLIAIVFIFFSFFMSCKKENYSKPKTKTELLTSKTWVYEEYFREYNSSNTVLVYKRGKSNNSFNLDLNKVTFRTDGTYTETTETGAILNGTWSFKNNETQTEVVNSVGTFTSSIVLLDENHYHWFIPTASNGTFGKLIPQ
jgi:hypothetical protein